MNKDKRATKKNKKFYKESKNERTERISWVYAVKLVSTINKEVK